jgi:hypothetical protein
MAGRYPDPVPGLMCVGGYNTSDDFDYAPTGDFTQTNFSPSTVTTSAGASSYGVWRLTTSGTVNTGCTITRAGNATLTAGVPTGMMYGARLRINQTSDISCWSGFTGSRSVVPRGANSVDFIGFRCEGGNWFGLCRSGANETTLDLDVGSDTEFYALRARKTSTGVAFDTIDVDVNRVIYTEIGEITTNIPTGTLYANPIGLDNLAAAAKSVEIDWYAIGGQHAR